jgi:ubiquinol-cytochrome c reductase cytochrome b subunit
MNKIIIWLDTRFPILSMWKCHFTEYYLPKNLNFLYLFGAFALLILVSQFITGLWLTMFYTPNAQGAFASIETIMRDVNYGWLLRYMHSTGASFFFIVIYIHIFKALLYGSYQKPRELVWLLGMGLYGLLMVEAFFGYVLPWGQMSYWGASVITNLFSAIPFIGDSLVTWIQGDYGVGNPTLHRFFALHIIAVPFLLLFFVYLHLVALRTVGSNNPEGIDILKEVDKAGKPLDGIAFFPYFVVKDMVGIMIFLILFFAVVFFAPDFGGYFLEPENFVEANPLVTPNLIVPAWYLSPFYAILRVIPHKLAGILVMGAAVVIFLFLPWMDNSPVKSMRYKGIFSRIALGGFVISVLLLGYLGRETLSPMRTLLAQMAIIVYFSYFLLMPLYTRYEKCKTPPKRIGGVL